MRQCREIKHKKTVSLQCLWGTLFVLSFELYLRINAEALQICISCAFRPKKTILQHSIAYRITLGPTQFTIQWAPGALSPEVKCLECEAKPSPLRLVPKSTVAERWDNFAFFYLTNYYTWKRTQVKVPCSLEIPVNITLHYITCALTM